jgi:short-subunit dehydrogenase
METTTQQPFAVVTGASHGIGYELARELFRRGYSLLICAEDEAINDAAQRIGNSVQALQVDLSSFEGVEQLCAALKRLNRPVDIAAINAGVGNGGAPFVESSLEADLAVINLNVTSAVHLAKRVAVDMVARGSGRILLTSSIASATPGPYNAVYHASKAFIQSFAEAIRNELQDTGVTVTALMPGATETDFFTRANMVETTVGQSAKDDPVQVAQQGIEALLAGKDHVVAGSFKNKVETVLAKVLPDTVNAQMGRKQNQPVR